MPTSKALGPNGMLALFFQTYRGIIGTYITKLVLDFLNNGVVPNDFNHKNSVLIPKIKNVKSLSHYRTISLYNMHAL